jgi:general secretion pathway protein C
MSATALSASPGRWAVPGLTFLLWGMAAASVVYWGFKLAARPAAAPLVAVAGRPAAAPDMAAVGRLLGATRTAAPAEPAVTLASRFSLVGVVARPSRVGIALIAVDGKPPRPYRVGATLDEGLVLQAVEGRRAMLGPEGGPATVTLELPPPRK